MNDDDLTKWFDEYLGVFAACGRGERDATALLAYYGVPALVTSNDAAMTLTREEQVLAMASQQIGALRAADYHHSDILASRVDILNAKSAIYRGEFARVRADGTEIGRLVVSYVITESAAGRRISALLVHRQ